MMRRIVARRIPLFIATLLLLLVGGSYAASPGPITTDTLQSLNGVLLNITGGFSVQSLQLAVVPYSASGTTSCIWATSTGPSCITALTAGDWEIVVQLVLNSVPTTLPASFTIQAGPNGAFLIPPSTVSGIAFSVQSGATANSSGSFTFDTGLTTIPATLAFTVVVR